MNDRIRVLQICHSHGPPFEAVADAYASWFPPDRFDLTTVFLKGRAKPLMANLERGKNEFYDLASKDLRGLKRKLVRRIRDSMRANRYSIVIAHRNKAIYVMCGAADRSCDATLIGVVHAFGVFAPISRRILAWRNRRRLKLIGVSEGVREDVLRSTRALGVESVHTVSNCLDMESFLESLSSRERAREFLGLQQDAYVVGVAGRLHVGKDHETLIRAFASVRDQLPGNAHLAIMGAGDHEAVLRRLVIERDCGSHVLFLGHVEQASRYFAAFDQFVLPSRQESFGLVLIEAMAAGVPVAAAASSGASEVMGDGSALFPVGDVAGCAKALLTCASTSPEERDVVTASASARVHQKFSTRAVGLTFWDLPFMRRHASFRSG